jgi:hypothetical protein
MDRTVAVAPSPEELDSLPEVYALVPATKEQRAAGTLEQVFAQTVQEQEAKDLLANDAHHTDPATRAIYVVGGVDLYTYYYIEIPFPTALKDADGGTIRLIMQHETHGADQVRVIDEHIGTEFDDPRYGRQGRMHGRYGWTRQSGGGEHAWILGDSKAHNLANPWNWAWITDYRWLQGNGVLPLDQIRIYSHPHVTTRVIIKD